MNDLVMTISTNGMDAMTKIAKEFGINVKFDESFSIAGDTYCHAYADTVDDARLLQRTYNERVRKLHQ